jgi:hypothetical protein
VPVFQHDFGFRDALIGGDRALKKVQLDPAGEAVILSQAETSLGLKIRLEGYDMAKRRMSTFKRLNSGQMEPCAAQRVGAYENLGFLLYKSFGKNAEALAALERAYNLFSEIDSPLRDGTRMLMD